MESQDTAWLDKTRISRPLAFVVHGASSLLGLESKLHFAPHLLTPVSSY